MLTVEMLRLAAMLVLFGAGWRLTTSFLADKPIGKAMAFVY